MLTERLSIRSIPARLNVRAGQLSVGYNAPDPFVDTQVSVTPFRSVIATSESSKIQIDTRAIQTDLGFLRINEFRRKMERISQKKAQEGIAERVSDGLAILDNPGRGTLPRLIAAKYGQNVQTQIAVRPGVPPEISFSEPSRILNDFEAGDVSVRGDATLEILPERTPPQIDLIEPGRVEISQVPFRGASVDFRA